MAEECADTVYAIEGNCCTNLGVAAPTPQAPIIIPDESEPIIQLATVLLPIDAGIGILTMGMTITAIITFAYKILGFRLIADDAPGNIELIVEYATNAAFPIFTEISGTERPTLVAAQEQENQAVATWITAGAAYSHLRARVVADSDVLTRVVLGIALEKL